MNKLVLHCVATTLLLGACASKQPMARTDFTSDQAMTQFRSADCCQSLSQIVATPLEAEISIPPASNRSLLNSPAGKGFYGAFALPDDDKTYYFRVESLVLRSAESSGHVVAPFVLILNQDFSISRASSPSMLTYHPENKFYGERESLYLFVKVDRKLRPTEKYVVVTTFEQLVGRDLDFTAVSGGGVMVMPLGKAIAVAPAPTIQRSATLRSSPIGQTRLIYLASKWDQPAYERSIRF